jgi:adenylosuccinate synthase
MKICVYGGLFGSEGKGCVAEWLAKSGDYRGKDKKLVVFGENAPNSGHTCSAGKTQNIPASSFFADGVVLGPDAVIDPDILLADLERVNTWRGKNGYKKDIDLYLHEHCGVLLPEDKLEEANVVARVSSTGSGSGAARVAKSFHRLPFRAVGHNHEVMSRLVKANVRFLNRFQWFTFLQSVKTEDWLFECSQGALLDTNWGYFPHVTARTTLPRTAIDRNGLSGFNWQYAGVYRTFPIRTGGPSGPCGGDEIQWEELGVSPEIASVTKRVRRVFEPSSDDFFLSIQLTLPQIVFFTHVDYLFEPHRAEFVNKEEKISPSSDVAVELFLKYLDEWMFNLQVHPTSQLWISHKPSEFIYVPLASLR